ncbi:MAG TPA: hypothetical protein PKN96_03820 [Flavobacterium sp.]|uniref:hypothetical protein n=1 Tax=Flavobacterium sp. TaxID=239 RepID=UPI002C7BF8E7|nr:hypothetical protein [Flavobacterium sp.]HNP32394.1 hypothetical protein [Flavobacterium sp.]
MKSKLTVKEFRNKLKANTKIGSPRFKIPLGVLALFVYNPKYFYGSFSDSSFELTSNSNFSPPLYMLKGSYKSNGNELDINYSVEPIGKLRIAWIKYFPIIAFIMFNCIFYFQTDVPTFVYVLFNGAIILMSLFARWDMEWKKKKLERKFNDLFEIENPYKI